MKNVEKKQGSTRQSQKILMVGLACLASTRAVATGPPTPAEFPLTSTINRPGDALCLMASTMATTPLKPIPLIAKITVTKEVLCLMASAIANAPASPI